MIEKSLIKNLDQLSTSGVFVLKNCVSRRVYINSSKNMLYIISRTIMEIKEGIYRYKDMEADYDHLELEILECGLDIETCREHHQYWVDNYTEAGWELYNARKQPEARTPKVVLLPEKGLVEVRLLNRRRDYKVVGVFNKVSDAEEFVEKCYKPELNKYNYTIFAANSLTRERVHRVK